MNAYHVIAKEHGFHNWNSLIVSPEAKPAASSTRGCRLVSSSINPHRSRRAVAVDPLFGFRPPHGTGSGHVDPIRTPDEFRRERDALLSTDGSDQVRAAIAFLEQLRPARIVRTSPSSYGLKHSAEAWHRKRGCGRYIGNGALIVAALIKGFAIKRGEVRSPNCLVGINVREVKALADGLAPATLRVRPSPFVRWLFAQAGRGDAVGDLAGDAKGDLRFPRGGLEEVETLPRPLRGPYSRGAGTGHFRVEFLQTSVAVVSRTLGLIRFPTHTRTLDLLRRSSTTSSRKRQRRGRVSPNGRRILSRRRSTDRRDASGSRPRASLTLSSVKIRASRPLRRHGNVHEPLIQEPLTTLWAW